MGEWLCGKLGTRLAEPYYCMGVFESGSLVAVMLYHNYSREAGVIEISGAAETARWLTKPVLHEMFAYPFDQLGCQNVVMRVSDKNTRLPRILTAYGFDSVHVPRIRGRDEGERVFWLTDEAWKANGFHREKADGEKRSG